MYALERQRWLVARARSVGRIDVNDAAALLDVAPETVRRDLSALERHGLVHRVHGGAIPVERLGFEHGLANRMATKQDEKAQIAQATVGHLGQAGSIFIDEGTTAAAVAELLEPKRQLTVVTSALPVACLLAARPLTTMLILGGRVRGNTLGAVDDWATRMLAEIVVDVAVLGTNGITAAHGLTAPDAAVAAVKRRAVASARRRVLVADHSKFGVDSSVSFATLREMDVVVTDRGTKARQVRELRRLGVDVVQS